MNPFFWGGGLGKKLVAILFPGRVLTPKTSKTKSFPPGLCRPCIWINDWRGDCIFGMTLWFPAIFRFLTDTSFFSDSSLFPAQGINVQRNQSGKVNLPRNEVSNLGDGETFECRRTIHSYYCGEWSFQFSTGRLAAVPPDSTPFSTGCIDPPGAHFRPATSAPVHLRQGRWCLGYRTEEHYPPPN